MTKRNNEEIRQETSKAHNNCDDFHATIEFIGKRWMGIIVYHLLDGPKRYHEILAEIEGLSDRLLTERLRELEAKGILLRHIRDSSERKVEYELTQAGKELEKPIHAIIQWTIENGCQTTINRR